jgi:hypothetical protein
VVTSEAAPGSGGVKAARPATGPVPKLDISMPAPAAPVRPPAQPAAAAPRFRPVASSPGDRPPATTPAPAAPAVTPPPRFKPVRTAEDPVIELTQKKGDSALIKLPLDEAPVETARPAETTPVRPPARSAGPLRPSETDSRVALLKTYVRRLDREVLGPEEEAALAQVVAILSGALSSDEDTLARRLRYLDQQFAADDASLFSRPVLDDLRALLGTLAAEAAERLRHACDQAQADQLLFVVDPPEVWDTPAALAVVKLATNPQGLRSGLLPSYLPRLRGPAVGFTFHAGVREGATLVRRVPENRLEIGFIAGPSRLWLTALHVLRSGAGLSIEQGGEDVPAYFEARLALPATEETHAVTQRFVLAEVARFVDRVAVA